VLARGRDARAKSPEGPFRVLPCAVASTEDPMSRRNRELGRRESQSPGADQRASGAPASPIAILSLVGIGIAVAVGVLDWTQTRKLQKTLEEKVSAIQGSVAALSTKVDQAAKGGQRAGAPDPNKVYAIPAGSSAIKGPRNAPVTLVE